MTVYHPNLASKALSLELYNLTGWDDVSHFCIKGGGIVCIDDVQRKFISKERLHAQYDLSYLLNKINSVLNPYEAYKQWYRQIHDGISLEDAACMLCIKLVNEDLI